MTCGSVTRRSDRHALLIPRVQVTDSCGQGEERSGTGHRFVEKQLQQRGFQCHTADPNNIANAVDMFIMSFKERQMLPNASKEVCLSSQVISDGFFPVVYHQHSCLARCTCTE